MKKLHNDDGYGVYFYSANGVTFPSLVETRNKGGDDPDQHRELYKKSTNFFNYYFSQLKKGDFIILSSRYELRWGNRPIPKDQQDLKFTYYDSSNKILSRDQSYKQWKTLFDNIAEKSLRKDIKVILFNHGNKSFKINNNDRIAQMILTPVIKMDLEETNELPESIRGADGFGSTGK